MEVETKRPQPYWLKCRGKNTYLFEDFCQIEQHFQYPLHRQYLINKGVNILLIDNEEVREYREGIFGTQ